METAKMDDRFPMFERTKRKNEYINTAVLSMVFNALSFLVEFIPCMYMADHLVDNDMLAFAAAVIGVLVTEVVGSIANAAFEVFQAKQKAYAELDAVE